MTITTQEQFLQLLQKTGIKSRLRQELRFTTSQEKLGKEAWSEVELVAITTRNQNVGVILLEISGNFFIAPFTLTKRIIDNQTGRAKAIICDFCYTWQAGSNSARITFTKANSANSVAFLCCADLWCSKHIRNLTTAANISRTQLREDMTTKDRIARLQARLHKLANQLDLKEIRI